MTTVQSHGVFTARTIVHSCIPSNTHFGDGQLQLNINKHICFAGVAHPHKPEPLTRIMLVLKWLSFLTLAAFTAADVPELIIDKTYVPTNCTVKSAKGDEIQVQYVSVASLLIAVRLTVTKVLNLNLSSRLVNSPTVTSSTQGMYSGPPWRLAC